MDAYLINPAKVRDLTHEALAPDGRPRVLPAAFWAATTPAERALFGTRNGIYGFPTEELVAHLRDLIAGRKAIEIGAGHGVLADALGIPATDNRMQEMPHIRAYYERMGQPIVNYGPNIERLDAHTAVRKYQPDIVIGCWISHKWDSARPEANGNMWGVDEVDILAKCATYIHIGNERTHKHSALWKHPHEIEYPPFVYSRAMNGGRDFIATWHN